MLVPQSCASRLLTPVSKEMMRYLENELTFRDRFCTFFFLVCREGCFKIQKFSISNFHISLKLTYDPFSLLIFFSRIIEPGFLPAGAPKFRPSRGGSFNMGQNFKFIVEPCK